MTDRERLSEHPAGEAHGRSLENGGALRRLIKNWKTENRTESRIALSQTRRIFLEEKMYSRKKLPVNRGNHFYRKKDFLRDGHRETENLLP